MQGMVVLVRPVGSANAGTNLAAYGEHFTDRVLHRTIDHTSACQPLPTGKRRCIQCVTRSRLLYVGLVSKAFISISRQ